MAKYSPIPVAYPTIADSTWTKINTVRGRDKAYQLIVNTDTSNIYRLLKLPSDLTSAVVNAAYADTDGLPLAPASSAGLAGGSDEETYDNLSCGDTWAYQASGGALATLAILEGR